MWMGSCKIVILFFSFGLFAQPQGIASWQKKFDNKWKLDSVMMQNKSLSGDSWELYQVSQSIDGLISMYRATKNENYLDNVIILINNIISTAKISKDLKRSQFLDYYYGWENRTNPFLKNDGKEYPLYESYCWRNITLVLRVMYIAPEILNKKKYKSFFDKTLMFTEVNIFNKWEARGRGHIYRTNMHMFSHWARISMDLWIITGKYKYFKVFDSFNDLLESQFKKTFFESKSFGWSAKWGH